MANWQQPSGYGYQGWNNQTPMAGANASLAQPIAPQATAQAPTQAYNSAPYYGQQAVAQPTQTYAYQQPAAPVYQQPVAQAPAGPHMGYAPPGVPQVQAPGVVPGVGQYGHVPPATGHLTSIPPAAQHPYPPSQHAQYAYTNTAASGYTTVVTSDRRSRSPDGGWSREDRSRRSVSSERDKRTGDRRHNRDRRSRSRERDRRRDSRGGSDDRHRGGSRDGDWDDYDSNSRDQYYDRGDRNYGRQARGNLVSVTDEYDEDQETFDARNYRGYRPDLRRQLDRKAPKKSAEVKQAEPQKSEPEEPAEDSGTSDIFKRLEAYKKKFNALKSSDKTEESSESAEGNKKDTTTSSDKKPSSSSRDTSQKSRQPDRKSDKSSSQSSSSARKLDHSSSRKPDHSSSRKPSDSSSRRPDHSSSRKPDQSPSRKPSESSSRKSDQSSSRKSDHSPARKPDNSSSRKSTDSPRRKSDQSSSKTSSNTPSRPPSKRPASGSDRRSPSKTTSQQSRTQTSKDNDAKKRKMTTEVSVTIGDKADTTKQTEADAKAKKAEADAKAKKAEADAKVKKAEADAKAKKVEADAKAKKAEADAKAKKAEADAKAKKAEADAKAKKAEADAKAKQAADVKAQFMKRKQEQLQLELAKQREKILEKRKAEAEEKESPQKKPKLSETAAEKTDADKTPDTSKHRPSTEENSEKRELPKIPLKKNIKEDRSPEVIVVEEETDKDSTDADKDKHESESETVVKTESKIDREEISEVLKMVFDGDEEMIEINIDTRETKAGQEGAEGGMSEAMLVDGGGRLGKHPMSRIDEFVRGMRDPDEALVGLQYLTEVIHLKGNKPNLYRCYCCNCHMYGGNIISHLTGQKHRFNYLERNYPSLYMKLHHNQNSRGQVHVECAKIEKDVGRQKVRCVESHLWTGQKKHERRIHLPDIKVISSSEPEPAEEPSQPSTLTEASNQTQPSSEPKTSSEPQASTSILEELSSPNEEGGIQVEHVCGVAAKQPEPSSSTKPDKPDSTAKQPDSTAKQSTSTAKEQESTAKQPESTAQQADVEDDDIQFVPEPTKAELLQKVVDAAVEKASPVAYHEGKHYVHFYKFIQNKADVPLLGLSEVVEISGFREGQGSRVQYVCKLCKVARFMSSKAMFDHTQSLLHLENYLERHHPRKVDAYDDIEQDKGRKMAVDNAAQLAFMEDGREDLLIARLEFPATDATAFKKPAAPVTATKPAVKPSTKPVAKPAEKATTVQTKITTPSAASSAESRVETAKEVDSKDIKVVLFDLLKGLDSIPIVGLNYITEIQNPSNVTRPSYQCKLCETNHSVNFINAHLTSSHHRTKFLRTNYPLLHSRTAGNKDLVNKYVKEIQGRYGRESVWVKTLVAKGPNGMPIYSEPVFVKGPWAPKPPPRSNIGPGGIPEEMVPVPQGAAPVVESIPVVESVPAVESVRAVKSVPSLVEKEVEKEEVKPAPVPSSSKPTPEFDRIIHGLDCTALLGLQYVTEIQHPKKTYPAKYECLLCHHVGNGTPLNTINILNHITARAHRMNYFRETHEDMYKQIISCRDSNAQNIVLAQHTKTVESTIGRGVVNVTISNDLSYWEDDDREAKEVAGKETSSGSGQTGPPVTSSGGAPDTPSKTEAAKPVKTVEEPEPMSPPALTDTVKKLVLEPKTSTMVKDIMLKKDGAFSWEREYGKLVQRLEEGTIIWSDRQSRYKTAFNTPQNIYSVIGIQWVLEVQRTNVRMEPYYLCRLCEERIIWKKIENHVNGLRHRISYMGHCYPLMYQFICQKKFTNIAGLRVRIDLYEKEIVKKEGTSQQPQVLLELDASQTGPAKQTGAQLVPAAKQTGAQTAVSSVQSGIQGSKSHTASSAPGTSLVQTPTSTTTIPVRVTTKYGGVPGTSQPVTGPTFTRPPVSAQPVSQATFKGQVYAPPVSSKPMPPVVSEPAAYTPASTRYPGTTYKAGVPSSSSSAHIPADSQGNRSIQSYSGPRPYATGTQQGRSTTTVPTSSTVTTKFGDKSQKDLEAISDDELSFDLIEISDDENFEDFDKPLTEKELKAVEEAYMKRLEEDEDILEELDLDDEEHKGDKELKGKEKEPFEPSGLVEVSVSLGPSVFEVTNSHQEQPRSSANIPGLTLIPEVKDEEDHEQEVKKSSTETDKSEKQTLMKNKSENVVVTKDKSKHSEKADDNKKSPSSKSKQHAKSRSEQTKTSAKKSSKDNEHKSVKPETSKATRDGKKIAKGKTPASPKPGTSKAGQSLSLLNKQPIVMLKRLTEQELKENLSSYKPGKAIDMNLPSTSSAKPVIVKKSAVSKPPKTPEKPKPVIVKEVPASSTSVDKSAKGPHPSPSPKKHDKKEKQDQQPSKTHSDKKSDKPSSKTDDKKDSARSSEKYDKKRKPESAEQRHKSDKESLRSPRSRDSDKKHRPDDKRHQQSSSPSVDKSDKVSRHIKSSKTSDKKDSTQSSKNSDKKGSTTSSKTSDRKESTSNSKTSHKTDSTSSSKQNEKTSKQEKPDQKQSKTLSGDEGGDKPDTKTNAVEVLVELGEEEEEQGGAEDFESFMAQFGDDFVTVDEFEDEPNSPMEIDVAVIIDELEPSDIEDASKDSEIKLNKKLSNKTEPTKEDELASSKTSNSKPESKVTKKTSRETEPRHKVNEKPDASQTYNTKDTNKSSEETGSSGSKKHKGKEILSASSMKTILKSVIAESVHVRKPSKESTKSKKTSETCEVSLSMEPKIVTEPIKKQNEETKSALSKKHSKDTESALIEKANEDTKSSEKHVSMETESASSEKLSVTIECELIEKPNNDDLSLDKQSSKETSVEQATASENTQENADKGLNDTTMQKTDVEERPNNSKVKLSEDTNLEQKKQPISDGTNTMTEETDQKKTTESKEGLKVAAKSQNAELRPSSLEKHLESKDIPEIKHPEIVISIETEDGAATFENREDLNAGKTESESTNDIKQKDSVNETVIECVVDSTIEKDSNESTCETEETSKVTATVEIEMSQEVEVKKTVIECVVGNTNEKDITEESSCETDEASKETVTVDVEAEMSKEVEIAVSIESDKSDDKDMAESGEDEDDDFSELVCVDEFEDDEEEEFTVVDEADNLKDQEETFITIDSKTSDSNDENNQSYVSIRVSQSDDDQMENLADDNDDDDDDDDVEGFEEFTTVDDIEDEPDGGPEGQVTDEATEETLDTSSSLKDGDSKQKQKEDFRPYCHWHPFEKSEHSISVDVDIATEEGADRGSTGQEFTTLDDIDDKLDGGAEGKKKDYQPYCKWHPFEKAEHPISVDVDIAMEEEADPGLPAKTDSVDLDSGKVAGETTPGKVRIEVELAASPDKSTAAAAGRKSGAKASSTASGSKSSGTGGKSSRSPAASKARSTGAGKKEAEKPGSDSHKADDAKKSSSEKSATTPHRSRHSSNEGSRHSSSEGHSRSGGHVHSSSTSESSRRSYESSSRGGECSSGEANRRADDSFSRGSGEYYWGKRWRPTERSQSYVRSRVNRQGDRSGGERRSRSRSPRDDRCQVSVEFD